MKETNGSELPTEKWEKTLGSIQVGGGKYCDEPSGAPEELKRSADKIASYVKSNRFNNS